MKKRLMSLILVSGVLLSSIPMNGLAMEQSEIEEKISLRNENSASFVLNPFVLGVDTSITGIVPPNGTDISLTVNGVEVGGFGTSPGQPINLTNISSITSPNDVVVVTIRNILFQIIGQEEVVIVDGTNINTGQVQPNRFLGDRFTKVTGSFTGSVGSVALRINGIINERQAVRANGTFSYDAGEKINNLSDNVEILVYNTSNVLVNFTPLTIEDGTDYGRILSVDVDRLHESLISVSAFVSIEANDANTIRVLVPEINGILYVDQSMVASTIVGNIRGTIAGVDIQDTVRLVGYNANGQVVDIFDVSGN